MHEITEIVQGIRNAQAQTILATVVDVVGSSYRRPGARMLIRADGSHIGSISGGCLEKDLCQHAARLTSNGPKLISFDTRDNSTQFNPRYRSGCHGIVYVLVQPVTSALACPARYLGQIVDQGEPQVIATVYQIDAIERRQHVFLGSTFESPYLPFLPPEQETQVKQIWQEVEEQGRSICCELQLDTGSMRLLIEKLQPAKPLWIFGSGDDGIPLSQMARQLGWEVTVCDHRASLLTTERFPGCRLVCKPWDLIPQSLSARTETAAVLITHNLNADKSLLPWLMGTNASYVGILGPKNRTGRVMRELAHEGNLPSVGTLDRLHTPVGLDIGASTPAEIAISIIAEIVAIERRRPGGTLQARTSPIHEPVRHHLVESSVSVRDAKPHASEPLETKP